jgi:hypothetical protein
MKGEHGRRCDAKGGHITIQMYSLSLALYRLVTEAKEVERNMAQDPGLTILVGAEFWFVQAVDAKTLGYENYSREMETWLVLVELTAIVHDFFPIRNLNPLRY